MASQIRMFAIGTLSMAAVVLLASCAGNSVAGTTSTINPAVAATSTPMVLTDAPGDEVVNLGLTINSIVLTDAAGKTASVLGAPVTVEGTHLDALQEPLQSPLSVPQDTYVSATFVVANPTVTYEDPTTDLPVTATPTLTTSTVTVTFATPIVVGATSSPLVFDLLVGPSVTIAGTTVTVTPTFNVSQETVNDHPSNESQGRLEGFFGQVVGVSGTTLTVRIPNGTTLTVATDSTTVLQGVTALSQLTANELVSVGLRETTAGTLLAERVTQLTNSAEDLYIGPVGTVTGSPATSLTQVARLQLVSSGAPATGAVNTVDLNSATQFTLAPMSATLPTLPFTPVFTAATLMGGQQVAVTTSSRNGSALVADSVTLVPQTVDGTVTAVSNAGGVPMYTLTLVAGSALAVASGQATVYVYGGQQMEDMNASSIAQLSAVRFHGLLFNDKGTLRLVALTSHDKAPSADPQTDH